MRLLFRFLIFFVAGSTCAITANAQICTGSLGAPVVNETFGSGSAPGGELPDGITNLKYINDVCGGDDGTYALLSSMGTSCKGATWKSFSHDHTGDVNGYTMIINATDDPSLFFTYLVKGDKLCPNTTYQFAAWIANILRDLPQTQGYSEPNITFSIETADGKVLQSFNTGNIKADNEADLTWKQYGTFFTTPADGSDIVVKMTNNSAGGLGNDLALDDITFSPCGPLIQRGFGTIGNTADKDNCIGDDVSYTVVAQQQGYPDPGYQWQANKNDGNGWVNIPGATTTSYSFNIPNAQPGLYQYRIGVLSSTNAGSEKCRIYSDPLNVYVHQLPAYPLPANSSVCVGYPYRLYADGGDSYLWTGPNGFTSTQHAALVSDSATTAIDGDYTLRIIKYGCAFFATTTLKVYPAVTVEPLQNVSICEGESVLLNLKSANATVYKWSPSEGLDHDEIPNPRASPSVTTTYSVSLSNDACPYFTKSAIMTVTVRKLPVANAGNSQRIFEGQTAKLQGTASGDSVKYFWTPSDYLDDPNSLTPTTSVPSNITYTLHVQSLVGCGESTSSVFVRVYKKLSIVNTFTPNGDGINDYWTITNMDDYPKATVSVFDRDGQMVFQSIGYGKPWDGTDGGKKVPPGTYYYMIDFMPENIPRLSGWVLVVR